VNSVFFWTYQVVLLLQLTIMIMGALGFKQSLRKKLEPNLPDKFIEKGPPGLSILAIIRQMQPDFWTMWVTGAIFAIGQGVATIIFLEYTAKAVTSIQAGAEMGEVRSALTKFAIAGVASAVGAIGSGVLFGLAGNRYVMRIRMQLLDSLMIQDMAFFDTISPGALIGHITGDTDRIGDLRDIIPKFLTPFCQVAFGAYTLFNTSWQLSLVVLALLVVEFIEASVRSKHVTHKYMRRYIKSNRGASEKATEVLASFTTVRLFGQERLEHDLYKEKTDFVKRVGAKKETLESIFQGIETMLHAAIIGLGTLYSFNLISEGLMSTESLNEFVLVGVSLITSFQDVIKTTPLAAETTGPLQVINDLITRIPRIDSNTGETIRNLQGHINFNKMSFTYPNAGTAAASAFENFNLDVPAGSSVAFVGPSGCGKSTLFKLVLRFYDPDAGSVKIDKNYDLRDLHLKWWLQNIGVVSQEAVLFKGTFRYNLLYGVQNPHEISEEQIMEACRQAQLTSLVQEKGLDFQVGDKGSSLSGGQKQRVCIARVFLRRTYMPSHSHSSVQNRLLIYLYIYRL
jgi:ABC-type multidrug transport system fused ATPase/permease subunit